MNSTYCSIMKSSSLLAVVMMAMVAAPASAQEAPVAAGDVASDATQNASGDVLVTARKRSESVLKTPVAVSVVTSEDIAKRGITSVSDLAANTPGMNINNNSSGRADRSFQQIIIRGFTPSTSLSTTTSTFIDGAPVSSPTAFSSITDPARIEVLKGPQSAYFGRNTFAGAVNVVNKLPTDDWAGSFGITGGSRKTYRLHGDVEGPIFGDALTFRVTGDKSAKDGTYRNQLTGDTLGDQASKSYTGLLVAKPFSGLTIKAFALYSQDDDGPSAQGLISAVGLKDAAGNTVVANQSNCTLQGLSSGTVGATGVTAVSNPYICGAAPGLSQYAPSQNTLVDQNVRNFLNTSTGRINGSDGVQGYGLLRRYHHYHLTADYEIAETGLTLSSITARNSEFYSVLSDLDGYGSYGVANSASAIAAGAATYWTYPFLIERKNDDFSQEVRLAYDKNGPFKATIGGSYLNNWVTSDLGGGTGNLTPTVALTSIAAKTRSRTFGGFFALSYKLFDKLTLNAEGRYQIDKLSAATVPTPVEATYKNFLPRIIAQFDFDRNTMVYASWSKGVNPGQFNTSFLTSPPATVALAQAAGINIVVEPEKVTNYEIGIKGKLLEGRLRYSLDAYFAQWRNQINTIALAVIDPGTGLPQLVQGTANTGSVNMKGIEFDGSYSVSDLVTINAAGSMNDSDIQSYVSPTVSKLTGIFDFSGKEMPNTSKWSASAGVQVGGNIVGLDKASWFARADYAYKSGVWANAANITRTKDYHNVNLRVGVTQGPASFDLFVNNVLNGKTYTSIADQFLFTPTFAYTSTNSAIAVGLRELRTFGGVMRYRF